MNIRIVDSWLREYLETRASVPEIAEKLSLTSVSVEKVEKTDNDSIYEIEVTTNRPDLMSVEGIAKEAAASLSQQGTAAKFIDKKISKPAEGPISFPLLITADQKLVNRVMAVVLEVEIGKSPEKISKRLEQSGIRSLNNVVDVTNYIMRETGHPAHVFDFDLLTSKKILIRESKKGEIIKTLDEKEYRLYGGDIVADDGSGTIIDLLGIMGTANSVVQGNTKRILFFLDNNNPINIRKTSMSLGIRTEAAILNEKGVDPQLLEKTFNMGVALYKEIAKGKVASKIYNYYPNKAKKAQVRIGFKKINEVIGVEISPATCTQILESLGFSVKKNQNDLEVEVPTIRGDVNSEEDIIEEIARIYGYQKLRSIVPTFLTNETKSYYDDFYMEERVKSAFKYWGYTEAYTYSLVGEEHYEGSVEEAIKLKNPLTEDMAYLRNSLAPSLIQVAKDNKSRDQLKIFELSNVYEKKGKDLPYEILTLGGLIKKRGASFFEIKGLIEQILTDFGIKNYKFRTRSQSPGAEIFIGDKKIGYIEILNQEVVDFELNFDEVKKHADFSKKYKQIAKFPGIVEDITFVLPEGVNSEEVISEISLQSFLIVDVVLKDTFNQAKTFHITYQAEDRNLTNSDVAEIRNEVIKAITQKFSATVK